MRYGLDIDNEILMKNILLLAFSTKLKTKTKKICLYQANNNDTQIFCFFRRQV